MTDIAVIALSLGLEKNHMMQDYQSNRAEQEKWQEMPLSKHMKIYEDKGLSRKEAMKAVAKDRGVSKREIYAKLLEDE